LLTVDKPLYLPAFVTVRALITSEDVIHSWAFPAANLKIDAVPGKLNQLWINLNGLGFFYGQCSELCGTNHAFMPINIIVEEPKFFFYSSLFAMIKYEQKDWLKKNLYYFK
jgi:heme/copper-type cytochrome/quinol oxidase subunit 2